MEEKADGSLITSIFRFNKIRLVEMCFIIEACFNGLQRRGLVLDQSVKLKDLTSTEDIHLEDVQYILQSVFSLVFINIKSKDGIIEFISKDNRATDSIIDTICKKARPAEFEQLYPNFRDAYNNDRYP